MVNCGQLSDEKRVESQGKIKGDLGCKSVWGGWDGLVNWGDYKSGELENN